MRILLLICVFCVAGTPSAFALKAASPEEIAAIQNQMHFANKMDAEVKKADLELYKAKAAKADKTEIIKRERMLAREKNKQSAARTVAIHMTIVAYGLELASPQGTSVVPLTKGRTIGWLPVAREREGRHIQDAAGESQYLAQPRKRLAGKLYPDGVAYIYPEAFQQGVGYLASTILHERIHFEQSTTAGRGDKLRRAESEVEALQAEKDNELYFFDPKDPADLAHMGALAVALADEKNAAAEDKKERAKILNRLRSLISPSAPLDMFESRVHTNAELADISGLVAQARGQAEMDRRDHKERLDQEKQRDHDERLKNAWAALALRSCANPGSVSQAELDSLPKPYDTDVLNSSPRGLGECGGLTYNMLMMGASAEAIRRISSSEGPVATQPPPPAEAIQPIRETPIARQSAPPPFSDAFPLMNEFALEACRAPEQVTIPSFLTLRYDFSHQAYDDELARKYAAGLSGCPSQLFNQLFAMMRAGDVYAIDRQWIRSKVAAAGGGSSGGRPQYGGPDQTHPIIVFPKPPW